LLIISENIYLTEKIAKQKNEACKKLYKLRLIHILPNFNILIVKNVIIKCYYQKTVVKLIFYVIGYKYICAKTNRF